MTHVIVLHFVADHGVGDDTLLIAFLEKAEDLLRRVGSLPFLLADRHQADAWPSDAAVYEESLPFEVRGMLRSRANTIEGGTTEVNKNVVGERVQGLPREPDPWRDAPWSEIPRS